MFVNTVDRQHQRGITLLEVLIALVILSIGLLGLAGLQLTGMRNNQDAYLRSQATIIAEDISDRMRANRDAAMDGDYDTDFGDGPPSGAAISAQDLNEWKNWIDTVLPGGQGRVQVDGDGNAEVQVRWDERSQEDEGEIEQITFGMETRL